MSLLDHRQLHTIFPNRELKNLYVTIAINAFADSLITIFVPIYLYELGFPIYSVIFFYFLMFLSFVLFSFIGAKTVSKIGCKHAMLWSTPFVIIYYLGFPLLPDYPYLIFILPIIFAGRAVLYNFGYHLLFLKNRSRKNEGKELSFIHAMVLVISVIAPLIGGIIAQYHFAYLYFLVSIIYFLANIPLFFTKDSHAPIKFGYKDAIKAILAKSERGSLLSFSGYAVESAIGAILWPVYIILIIGGIEKTGYIVTLSLLLSVLAFYTIGKWTDVYDKYKLLRIGSFLYFFGWVLRVFTHSTLGIFLVDSYKNVTQKILHIPWGAACYDLAEQDKLGGFFFFFRREVIFNLARIVVMPFIFALFYFDFYPFSISFIIAAVCSLGYSRLSQSKIKNPSK
jgi:MFS family permease